MARFVSDASFCQCVKNTLVLRGSNEHSLKIIALLIALTSILRIVQVHLSGFCIIIATNVRVLYNNSNKCQGFV